MAKKKPVAPKWVKFKCPDCGSDKAQCLEVNAVVSSPIQKMAPDGDMVYGTPCIDESEVDSYGCVDCGFKAKADGSVITDCEEFAKWCLVHCPQGD